MSRNTSFEFGTSVDVPKYKLTSQKNHKLGLGGPPRSGGDFWIWGGLCRKSYPTQNRSGGTFPTRALPPRMGGTFGCLGGSRGGSYFLKNNLLLPRMGGTPGGFGGDWSLEGFGSFW